MVEEGKGPKRHKIVKRVIIAVVAVIIAALLATVVYMSIPLKATDEAKAIMTSSDQTVFTPSGLGAADGAGDSGDSNSSNGTSEYDHYEYGLIFYPGAKVEAQAYAPLMQKIADRGWLCVLVDAPFHFAPLNPNAADQVIASHPEVDHWYVGGHSLGGVVACGYAANHADSLAGVVLCASYSSVDLSNTTLDIVSVRGTNDGVLIASQLEDSLKLMPASYRELVIEGGNHAQFGNYGAQAGDNPATISADDQQTQAADFITER